MDNLKKEQRRRNMQAIRGTGSKIEVLMAKALWKSGLRYRRNNRKIVGKPDFTFRRYKIAVFVDGEFWHGRDWEIRKKAIKSNHEFWFNKIERNIERDRAVNQTLTEHGWIVLRFWGDDVSKNLADCVNTVDKAVKDIQAKLNARVKN